MELAHSDGSNKYTQSMYGAEISKYLTEFILQPLAITYMYFIGELTKCMCLCTDIDATN